MTKEQRIGLFFVTALVLLVAAVELTLGLRLWGRRYTIYATFRDVQGLDVGADVRLAGLKAGRVQGMEIAADHVRVALAVDDTLVVRSDAIARLDFRALSGERFVALTLGSPEAKPVEPGGEIEGETPASFGDAMNQLTEVAQTVNELARSLDENGSRLLGSLADVVDENRRALGEIGDRMASITTKIDKGTGTLSLLLNDPALYDRATAALGEVRASVQELNKIVTNVSDGRSTVGKLLTRDDGLYDQMREAVDQLGTAARSAEEITQSLQAGQGTLGKALADDTLYNESVDAVRTAGRAAQSVEDQAPISLLSTIITSLF
jgi:phospholipid/cholesterol/gamma-HCH transport system substrate-binding protein